MSCRATLSLEQPCIGYDLIDSVFGFARPSVGGERSCTPTEDSR